MVSTAALVILLSAFNGIEKMVEKLYTDFDPDITIRSATGKTFFSNQIDVKAIQSVRGVQQTSFGIEEVVVLKHEKKWVNANLLGVDEHFLKLTKMPEHMVDGYPNLMEQNSSVAIIGASLLDKLEGFIPSTGYESLTIYSPKRNLKMRLGKSPFETRQINLAGRMNFNREVNAEFIVVPIDFARNLLAYSSENSVLFVDVQAGIENESVQEKLKQMLGDGFVIKTNYEKNELIYKTSQSEKIIVIVILLFIFIIAAFTLVAALTMMFVEKKENLGTLQALGADKKFVFKIFFTEGLLISSFGVLMGLLFGYVICFSQIQFHILTMPNSAGEPFPMKISLQDAILILSLVGVISVLASYLPAKYLLRRDNLLLKKNE